MKEAIKEFIESLELSLISNDRKVDLQRVIDLIENRKNQSISLNFVCTHNSRRSHLAQIWAEVMAKYYEFPDELNTFSSGTESTALFPVVAVALERQGFEIDQDQNKENPRYSIHYSEDDLPINCFSKRFDHSSINGEYLAAIMVCSDAEKNCPLIPGVKERLLLKYEDPKNYDDSPIQLEKYMERSSQIAREMKYIFSMVQREEHVS